ncbi:MAG: flagellar motor switch protein FliN [Aquificae bacterium]|nr:flagellar motor switch protein FliN [Aquificota bacterium]
MSEEEKNQQENKENQQEETQEDLASAWEEMVNQQEQETEENTQEDLASAWEEALSQQQPTEEKTEEPEEKQTAVTLTEEEKLVFLMDIPLEISVEIGSTKMPLEEILKLNPNSVVELDKFINQPVDLKINGRLIAQGELYTVKNHFGIKITNIITPQERLKILDEII